MKEQLKEEILNLSREERLLLLHIIIDSIRLEDFHLSDSDAQEAELEKRSKSLRDGTAEFVTWEEIFTLR